MKFPNLKFNVYSLCISALFLGSYQTSAMAFTLDLFTDAQNGSSQKVTLDPDLNQFTGSDTDMLPGTELGQRTLDLTISSTSPTSLGIASLKVANGKGSINSDSDTFISLAKFTWGSALTTPKDITTGGIDNSFQLNVLTVDLQGSTFTFTVKDEDGDEGSVSQNISSIGDKYFSYQNFPANVDKTRIRQVSLGITGAPPSFDATFDFIKSAQQVPFDFSPSLGLVCCGGLFGLNKFRKRLKSSQY